MNLSKRELSIILLACLQFIIIFPLGCYGNLRPTNEHHKAFLGKLKDDYDHLSVEESIRRLRLLAPHIDINKDGFISPKELEIWVRDKYTSLLESDDVDFKFREMDFIHDNLVTWHEYTMRHYGFNNTATDDFTMELKKHFGDYVKRDERRWKYADVDEDNVLNLEEFHMFFKPNKYAEMMDVVAMEELEHYDIDKDGFLSMEEYIKAIGMPSMRPLDEKKFTEELDIDKDGKLNKDEVKIWKTPAIYDKAELESSELINIADDNQDGKLTIDEIVQNHFVFVGSKATISGTMLHDEF